MAVEYVLSYDDANGSLHISDDVCPDGCILLDSFSRYDDALDTMSDLRALCVDGVTMHDVILMTYGSLCDMDGGDDEHVHVVCPEALLVDM